MIPKQMIPKDAEEAGTLARQGNPPLLIFLFRLLHHPGWPNGCYSLPGPAWNFRPMADQFPRHS